MLIPIHLDYTFVCGKPFIREIAYRHPVNGLYRKRISPSRYCHDGAPHLVTTFRKLRKMERCCFVLRNVADEAVFRRIWRAVLHCSPPTTHIISDLVPDTSPIADGNASEIVTAMAQQLRKIQR